VMASPKRKASVLDDEEEREHFVRIINAFKYYRCHSVQRVSRADQFYSHLSKHHKQLMPNFSKHLGSIRQCINHNYEIIKLIIKNTDHIFENMKHRGDDDDDFVGDSLEAVTRPASGFDMDKLKTTLKQIVRDWSIDGAEERQTCYQPVVDAIKQYVPLNKDKDSNRPPTVLVPGAGLGRLAYEIALCGYVCQGNEFSLFMLFTSNFILNSCNDTDCFTLYPWVHQWCNNKKSADQTRPITFPDVNPAAIAPGSDFTMAAGDFLEVYNEKEHWDCVATVFFIDTAHNVITYLERIWHILKPGGVWINLGPLLYHFADLTNEESIELSYEDLKHVIEKIGFKYLKEDTNVASTYTQNPRSMLKYEYESVFFVVQKPMPIIESTR
ncbi:unnamed protein product, partial [Owenia fusiformis]